MSDQPVQPHPLEASIDQGLQSIIAHTGNIAVAINSGRKDDLEQHRKMLNGAVRLVNRVLDQLLLLGNNSSSEDQEEQEEGEGGDEAYDDDGDEEEWASEDEGRKDEEELRRSEEQERRERNMARFMADYERDREKRRQWLAKQKR